MRYFFLFLTLIFISCNSQEKESENILKVKEQPTYQVQKSETEWRKQLSEEEYYVLREAGTERPHSGKFNLHFEEGIYTCKACGEELFGSDSKFESHCGWPSFDKSIAKGKIVERLDKSHGMMRMEILCRNCGSHLGHVFTDGPTATGLRYCVNSISLEFKEEKE